MSEELGECPNGTKEEIQMSEPIKNSSDFEGELMDQVWLCYVYDANDDSCRESVVAVAATEDLANEWLAKARVEFGRRFFWNPDFCTPGIRAVSLGNSKVDNMYPFDQPYVDPVATEGENNE